MPRRILLALVFAVSPAYVQPLPGSSALSRIAWLAGCWRADGGDPGSVEQWLPPAGGTMFGVSRTVRDGKTIAFEFMQLRMGSRGTLVFIAHPSGKPATEFALVHETPDSFTFENPAHDFPQRVIYRRLPDGKLLGRIEGIVDGKVRSVDFPMSRIACDP